MGEFNQVLEKYAKYVIQQSRSNLTKAGKGRGNLSKSLEYFIQDTRVTFKSEEYGVFVDKGVKGKDPSKVSPNAKIKGQQAPNSKYRFGSGKSNKTFKDFARNMSVWAKSKNIRFRDEKGRFAKGAYKSLGYVIASNIYNRGIRPTMFFTKPFEAGIVKYSDEMIEAIFNDNIKL